jgi:2'-5' RNA ligase
MTHQTTTNDSKTAATTPKNKLTIVDWCKRDQKWLGLHIPFKPSEGFEQQCKPYLDTTPMIKKTPPEDYHITLIYWGDSNKERWDAAAKLVEDCNLTDADVLIEPPRFFQPKYDAAKKFNSGFIVCGVQSEKIKRLQRLLQELYPVDRQHNKTYDPNFPLHMTMYITQRSREYCGVPKFVIDKYSPFLLLVSVIGTVLSLLMMVNQSKK